MVVVVVVAHSWLFLGKGATDQMSRMDQVWKACHGDLLDMASYRFIVRRGAQWAPACLYMVLCRCSLIRTRPCSLEYAVCNTSISFNFPFTYIYMLSSVGTHQLKTQCPRGIFQTLGPHRAFRCQGWHFGIRSEILNAQEKLLYVYAR